MLSGTGSEENLAIALATPRVQFAETEDIKKVLRYIMLKLGIREANLPSPEEKQILLEHICKNYAGHTVQEIRLAFDMAIAGQLNLSEKEVNPYENFSCMYFSKIMSAYRVWANESIKQLKLEPLPELNAAPLTDEQLQQWVKEMKSQKIKTVLLPVLLYDKLYEKQLITQDYKDPEYEQAAIAFRQAFLYKQNGRYATDTKLAKEFNQFMRMKQQGFFEEPEISKIHDVAKKLILREYLKTV